MLNALLFFLINKIIKILFLNQNLKKNNLKNSKNPLKIELTIPENNQNLLPINDLKQKNSKTRLSRERNHNIQIPRQPIYFFFCTYIRKYVREELEDPKTQKQQFE